ncbi:MAG: hypothetical protein J1F67_10930 [Muribaculaceae bacterium]|nr:hypothetical protein [Muribaculaceae bacterium]
MRQLKLTGCAYSLKGPKNSDEVLKKIEEIKEELEAKIEQKLIERDLIRYKNQLGFCHTYWGIKAEILKNEYGIKWLSPAECNPLEKYD